MSEDVSLTSGTIPVTGNAFHGATTLSWNAPDAKVIEVHVGSPAGPVFAEGGNRGSVDTGVWVADGMVFYLQDVSDGRPLTADYTLATVVVRFERRGSASLRPQNGPGRWAWGAALVLGFGLFAIVSGQHVRLRRTALLILAALALSRVTLAQTSKLDEMVKAGASQKELANYVFDTHGCKNCHTIGQNGKLGFTAKGRERAQGFEGCINMLTAMTVIVQVPEEKRSSAQRQKAQRFEEFGCTSCHQLTPGKLGLTEVGAKLAHLHLGCLELEKLTSSGPAAQGGGRH